MHSWYREQCKNHGRVVFENRSRVIVSLFYHCWLDYWIASFISFHSLFPQRQFLQKFSFLLNMFNYKTSCIPGIWKVWYKQKCICLRCSIVQSLGCYMVYWYNKSKQQKENERITLYTIGHEQMSCNNKHISAACVLFFFICFRTH